MCVCLCMLLACVFVSVYLLLLVCAPLEMYMYVAVSVVTSVQIYCCYTVRNVTSLDSSESVMHTKKVHFSNYRECREVREKMKRK